MRQIKSHYGLFAISPLFLPIILSAAALGLFYYLQTNGLFPEWIDYIYIGVKVFIALQVIIGAARTFLMPLLVLAIGLLIIFTSQVYHINLISNADTWQIFILAGVSFFISVITKI